MGADDELVMGVSCAGISVTEEYVVSSSWVIMFGFVVGRDVFVSDLCIGCLY